MGVFFPSDNLDYYGNTINFNMLATEMFGFSGSTIKSRMRYKYYTIENDAWACDYRTLKSPQIFYLKADALTMLLLRWQPDKITWSGQ